MKPRELKLNKVYINVEPIYCSWPNDVPWCQESIRWEFISKNKLTRGLYDFRLLDEFSAFNNGRLWNRVGDILSLTYRNIKSFKLVPKQEKILRINLIDL